MKLKLLIVPFLSLLLIACSTAQVQEAETVGESIAWTTANAYETANTASGGALTTSLVNAALVATHNTPDIAAADALASVANTAVTPVIVAQTKAIQTKLATAVTSAGATAQAAGASPAGIQAAQTAVLSDPGVIESAAAAAPALSVPVSAVQTLAAVPSNP